jgi:hypothetical protein
MRSRLHRGSNEQYLATKRAPLQLQAFDSEHDPYLFFGIELATGLASDVFDGIFCRLSLLPGFHSHLHSLKITMSLKSSIMQ